VRPWVQSHCHQKKEGRKEGRTKSVRMDLEKVVEKNKQNTAQKLTWEITNPIRVGVGSKYLMFSVHYAGGSNTIIDADYRVFIGGVNNCASHLLSDRRESGSSQPGPGDCSSSCNIHSTKFSNYLTQWETVFLLPHLGFHKKRNWVELNICGTIPTCLENNTTLTNHTANQKF
jgi:hypothetical protein